MLLHPRPLSVEQIETAGQSFKDDLTRECERLVMRNDNSGALAAIKGKKYIDDFIYTLKLRAGHQGFGFPARPAEPSLPPRPPRARPIRLLRDRSFGSEKSKGEST
jgi:hypothetical protein